MVFPAPRVTQAAVDTVVAAKWSPPAEKKKKGLYIPRNAALLKWGYGLSCKYNIALQLIARTPRSHLFYLECTCSLVMNASVV